MSRWYGWYDREPLREPRPWDVPQLNWHTLDGALFTADNATLTGVRVSRRVRLVVVRDESCRSQP